MSELVLKSKLQKASLEVFLGNMEIVNDRRRAVITKRISGFALRRYIKANSAWRFIVVGRENFKKEETAIKQAQNWVDQGKF